VTRPVTVSWAGVESVPIQMANQFLVQIDAVGPVPDVLVLAIGQATPPAVLGSAEEKAEQMRRVTSVNVIPLARYVITPARLTELVDLLTKIQTAFVQMSETGEVPEL
jgi:hypothetical protein